MAPLRKRRSHAPSETVLGAFAGEYQIVRKLGSGGFGAVYEAEHPLLKRKAAVKVLHANRSLDDVAVKRFIAEAQAASQIRHRHMVDIFSFGQLASGQLFYVMDLLDGVPLDAYLLAEGKLAPELAIALLRPVAHALDALHATGAVHRDVKPGNIFLAWESSAEVVPKLLDFGLIKLVSNAPVSTASDVLMGTPYYMAPEQCRGELVDARSDVYALGVICHELCTGGVPFPGDSVSAILLANVLQPPPPMSQSNPALPASLDAPVLAMLAKDPAQRPTSAGAAFDSLEQAAREAGLVVPGAPLRLRRPEVPSEVETAETLAQRDADVSSLNALRGSASGVKRTERGSLLAWGLLALGLVAGIALVMWLRTVPSEGVPAASSRAPAPPAAAASNAEVPLSAGPSSAGVAPAAAIPASPTAGDVAPAAPTQVRLVLKGAPEHATVRNEDRPLGAAGAPLLLPTSAAAVALTVEADGFEPRPLRVVPDRDQELDATLKKARPRAKRGRVSHDLENPF